MEIIAAAEIDGVRCRHRSSAITFIVAASMAFGLFACVTCKFALAQENAAELPTPNQVATSTALRLGAGDLIEIMVYGVPELSTKARVGGNGDIYLPLIDYVHVDGLTS